MECVELAAGVASLEAVAACRVCSWFVALIADEEWMG